MSDENLSASLKPGRATMGTEPSVQLEDDVEKHNCAEQEMHYRGHQ